MCNTKSKVSVVPVYNVEKYLEKCLDSIISQTLEEIEIIMIDDGSTDKSGAICDEYALKDARISVIHKRNEGLSCARNDGIGLSSAKYILFVDSDDWIEKESCEILYYIANKHKADLVFFTYSKHYESGKIIPVKTNVQSGAMNELEAFAFNTRGFHSTWLGVYHRKLFEHVRFPVGKVYEDLGTTHKLIHAAQRIFYIDKTLYHYRCQRRGSITTEPRTKTHQDADEMRCIRIKDLYEWGYGNLIQRDAFSILISYGRKSTISADALAIVNMIGRKGGEDFSKKQRIMLAIYQRSPLVFDAVCYLMGKRKEIKVT